MLGMGQIPYLARQIRRVDRAVAACDFKAFSEEPSSRSANSSSTGYIELAHDLPTLNWR